MNAHDLEAFVACFAEDYDSVQPAASRPRLSRARAGARELGAVFAGVPDFRAELLGVAAAGDTVWSEWHWEGTQSDGGRLDMAGVRSSAPATTASPGRGSLEPVEQAGAGIEAAGRDMTAEH